MGIEKKVISVRLDEEFVEILRKEAEREYRSLSGFISHALKKHMEKALAPEKPRIAPKD